MTYRATQAETLKFKGHKGDEGDAYYARPSGAGKYRRQVEQNQPAFFQMPTSQFFLDF